MNQLRHGAGAQGRVAGVVALVAAIGLAAFGVVRGTWSVGGSDSSCYALMAKSFARGDLQPHSALATAPWPDVPLTLAPGGFIPSSLQPDAASPICAPGMSVLMAPLAKAFGQDAIFWLTPIAAFVLVLAAFAIARQLAGGVAGAAVDGPQLLGQKAVAGDARGEAGDGVLLVGSSWGHEVEASVR